METQEKDKPILKIWRTVKLGTGLKTADDFRQALKNGRYEVSDETNDILNKPAFTVNFTETEVELVKISVAELGFKKGATRKKIYERAKKLGLDICLPEVGPQLRLQYPDQPLGECLWIGMEPITDSDGNLSVFSVCSMGRPWYLESYYSECSLGSTYKDSTIWIADSQWVFARRK